jgi:hypothetical protein
MEIEATVVRGRFTGEVVIPHRSKRGYVVSPSRFERDQRYVSTLAEVADAVRSGLGVRMSGPRGYAPSLFMPGSIRIRS